MPSVIHLNNAPIVEGLIDIRVKPAADLKMEGLAVVRDLLKDHYPTHKEAVQIRASIELKGEEVPQQSVASQKVGYRLESSDGKYVFQAQTGGFTLSRLKPYETWELLRDEAKRLWKIYKDVAKPQTVTRVATRYINRINITDPNLDFDNYLTAPPPIPKELPQIVGQFLSRVVMPDKKTGAAIIFTQALEPANPATNSVPVIIDIDVFKEVAIDVESDEYWQLLEELRHLKNAVFFGSITEKTQELLK